MINKKIQWENYIIYLIFLGILVIFSIFLYDKGFLSINNLMNIIRQGAMLAIMAVGMTFVLSAAEIDLSLGSIVSISAIITAMTLNSTNSIILSILVGLGIGLLIGLTNGFLVAKFQIPSFLVTLGMSTIILGISREVSGLQSIPINNNTFTYIFGSGNIGPISILFLWLFIIAFFGHFVLKKTPYGRKVLATGGNKTAALYSGINVYRIKISVMAINGFLASLAGILYAGRLHGARYTLGEDDLMTVIAATIIGGTSMFGGKGSVIGSVFGALLMAMLKNGLVLFGFSVNQQMIFQGAIIILAVTLTMRKNKD